MSLRPVAHSAIAEDLQLFPRVGKSKGISTSLSIIYCKPTWRIGSMTSWSRLPDLALSAVILNIYIVFA